MVYIYKIINLINNKLYIGKTSNSIEERWKEHISDSKKERCEKRPLYDAFNKYGIENFQIEEIEQVENDEIACQKEIYWIDKLRTYIGFNDCNGYNATLGGDSKRYYNYKELAQAYLDLGTVKAAAEQFNCDLETIRKACKENNIEIKSCPRQKRIRRISKNGEIKEYESINDAAKDIPNKSLKLANDNIWKVLHNPNRHTAWGYKWEFIE